MGFWEESHYYWLDNNLPAFFEKCGIDMMARCPGIISAHGDKGSCYLFNWNKAGIHYFHGMAIFLLSYCKPYSDEVRESKSGKWVNVEQWVIDNYPRFKDKLPPVPKGTRYDLPE